MYTADSLTLDLLSLTKEGSGLMTNLGSVEWLCKDIKSSLPLHYRSSNSYHSNKLVKICTIKIQRAFKKYFIFQGYYLMQQGGVISFSDSESFLVRIANIWGLQRDCSMYLLQKSHVKTLSRMFDILSSIPFSP